MQKLPFLMTGWSLMFFNWIDAKIAVLDKIFTSFHVSDPAHLEHITGSIMNVMGILSFAVGIILAVVRYIKKR